MRSIIIFVLASFIITTGCTGNADYKKPDDPLEAGREFIRFALDGDMRRAKTFILPDAANERLFENIEKKYAAESQEEKDNYKDASIIINKFRPLNDSVSIINYSNSFKKEDSEIKLIRRNGEWWIDFKYTFTGDTATE
jgi:negative regulator of genetic competence, sporulation and motility